jgi:hypothetical protein
MGIDLADPPNGTSRFRLGGYMARFLCWRGIGKPSISEPYATRAAAQARSVLRDLYVTASPAPAIGPLPARAAAAGRNARLVGIEPSFQRALKLAKLGFDSPARTSQFRR